MLLPAPAAWAQDTGYGCDLDARMCRTACSRSSSATPMPERINVLRSCLQQCAADVPLCKRQATQGQQRGARAPLAAAPTAGPGRSVGAADASAAPVPVPAPADSGGVDIRSLALQAAPSRRDCPAALSFGNTLPSGRLLMEPQALAEAKQLRRQVLAYFNAQSGESRGLQAERDRLATRIDQRTAALQRDADPRPSIQARIARSEAEGQLAGDKAKLVEIDRRLAARSNMPIRDEERQAVARHFELLGRLHTDATRAIADEAADNVLLFVNLREVARTHLQGCLLGPMTAWGAGALQAPWDQAEAQLDQLAPQMYARGRVALRDALRRVDDDRVLARLESGLRAAEPVKTLVREDAELNRTIDQQRDKLLAEREARERPIREAEAAERKRQQQDAERRRQEAERQRLAAVDRAARKAAPEPADVQTAWINEIVAAYPHAQPFNERAATVYALPDQTLEMYTLWLTVSSARCSATGAGAYRCGVLATFNRTSRNPLTAWASAWVPDIPIQRDVDLVWRGTQLRSSTFAGMLTAMRGSPGSGSSRSSSDDGIPSMDLSGLDDIHQRSIDEKKELSDRREWEERNDTRNRSR